jgi:hypothetical protein
MLNAMMQENEQLKSRIADVEGNYLRLARLNEAYRVELIGHRRRVSPSFNSLFVFPLRDFVRTFCPGTHHVIAPFLFGALTFYRGYSS